MPRSYPGPAWAALGSSSSPTAGGSGARPWVGQGKSWRGSGGRGGRSGRLRHCPHFTDEETKAPRACHLPSATLLVTGEGCPGAQIC